jgi:putative chitinase
MQTHDVPGFLRTIRGASWSAAWFFAKVAGCNELADSGNIDAVSKRINGGANGLQDRRDRYETACAVFGARALA